MKYYFNTYYVNCAISTEHKLYIEFKKTCSELVPSLSEVIVKYGNCEEFEQKYFQTNYWEKYNGNIYENINYEFMKEILENIDSSDILYTGAGISREAGIPTQNELEDILYLHDIINLFKYATINPEVLISKFRFFYLRLITSNPTKVHYKIKELYDQKKFIVVTENLDRLHNKTNLKTIRADIEQKQLLDMRPRRVFLIGVGNPCCQYLLKYWYDRGSIIYAVSLTQPNINVKHLNKQEENPL